MEFKDFRTLLFSTSFVLACINVSIIAILSDLNYNSTCLSVSHLICKLFVNRYAKKKKKLRSIPYYVICCRFKLRLYVIFTSMSILAGSSSLTHVDEQRPSASTSQRTDATSLVAGEETAVETARQERTPEEDIIGITGNANEIFIFYF